jgi:photosystem II stability/assembly factor-like uncharacterized protein
MRSNRDISELPPLFMDPLLAGAAMDRLLHHCHVLVLEGHSYRNPPTNGPSQIQGERVAEDDHVCRATHAPASTRSCRCAGAGFADRVLAAKPRPPILPGTISAITFCRAAPDHITRALTSREAAPRISPLWKGDNMTRVVVTMVLLFCCTLNAHATLNSFVEVRGTYLASTTDGRVFISTNKGKSWWESGAGLPRHRLWLIKFGKDAVLGFTTKGLFVSRSSPPGLTWETLLSGATLRQVAASPNGKELLVADQYSRLLHSVDGGKRWNKVKKRPPAQVSSLALAPLRRGKKHIWLLSDGLRKIYRSTNRGKKWKLVFETPKGQADLGAYQRMGNPWKHIEVSYCGRGRNAKYPNRKGWLGLVADADGSVYGGPQQWLCTLGRYQPNNGGLDLLVSRNRGRTWKLRHFAARGTAVFSPSIIALQPTGTLTASAFGKLVTFDTKSFRVRASRWLHDAIGVGSKLGVFASKRFIINDQGTSYPAPMSHKGFKPLATKTGRIVLQENVLHRVPKGGVPVRIQAGISGNVVRVVGNDDHLLVATDTGQIYSSENMGLSWTHMGKAPVPWLTVLTRAGANLVAAGVGGIRTSKDKGKSWQLAQTDRSIKAVWALARVKGRTKSLLLASTMTGLMVSADGNKWSSLKPPTTVRSLVPLANGQVLAASDVGALLVSVDGSDRAQVEMIEAGKGGAVRRCFRATTKDPLDKYLAKLPAPQRARVAARLKRERLEAICYDAGHKQVAFLPRSRRFKASGNDAPQGVVSLTTSTGNWVLAWTNDRQGRFLRYSTSNGGRRWHVAPDPSIVHGRVKGIFFKSFQRARDNRLQPTLTTGKGVYLFNGTRWVRLGPGGSCALRKRMVFCLHDGKVRLSTDVGATFRVMSPVQGKGIGVSSANPKVIWAGDSVSVDGGWTFKKYMLHGWKARLVHALPDGSALVQRSDSTNRTLWWARNPRKPKLTLLAKATVSHGAGWANYTCRHAGSVPWIYCRFSGSNRILAAPLKGLGMAADVVQRKGPKKPLLPILATFPLPTLGAMHVIEAGRKLLVSSNVGLWISTNNGKTWVSFDGSSPKGPPSESKSKSDEAKLALQRLKKGAKSYFQADQYSSAGKLAPKRFPESSRGWVPATPCCKHGNGSKCQIDPGLWTKKPWSQLRFSMRAPHYYQYRFTSQGTGKKASFLIEARGDLNCDGTYSSFKLKGSVSAEWGVVTKAPIITKELE